MNIKKQPSCFVAQIDSSKFNKLRDLLIEENFELGERPYAEFAAKKKGLSCTLYSSGKIVVQGKEMDSFIRYQLEPQILESFDYSYKDLNLDKTPRIGIDESGKGDFFGPLCVAGVYADAEGIEKLSALGIKDSKKINDKQILVFAKEIRKICRHNVVKFVPIKYNELYQKFGNLNKMLAWGHATAIANLVEHTGCHNVLIDQFAAEYVVQNALNQKKISVDLKQRHKAESDVVVAAASVMARAAYLDGLRSLEEEFSSPLPKGASAQVKEAARKFVRKHSEKELSSVAKRHFKTYKEVLESL